MQQEELNFRLLFEESPEMLLVLQPDAPRYRILTATRAYLTATHINYEQSVGRGLFEVFPDNPDDPQADGTSNLRQSLDRVVATHAADTMAVQKYDIRRPDGGFQVKYWSPKNFPVLGARGELLYILHRVEDVTDLVLASKTGDVLRDRNRQMEHEVIKRSAELSAAVQELRTANTRLGELDAAKTAFFSNVSHEFRTPLTLMLGPIEDALADRIEPLSTAQYQRIQLAYNNALRLYKLVNSLLDFSRLEAGRQRASFAPIDLAQFTLQLAGMFQSAMDKSGIQLHIDCAPLSEPIWIDHDMWEKIVPNLISNALKFTHHGSITVRLREQPQQVTLEVTDTGIGIAATDLPRIFERFHRIDAAHGRTYEGTGIGLSLVHELVHLHGGSIVVNSEPGRGSTFTVSIPKGYAHLPQDALQTITGTLQIGRDSLAYVNEAVNWNDGAAAVDTIRTTIINSGQQRSPVLVVDDNADLREYLKALLAPSYEVTTANDGQAALLTIREQLPELVLSDVMMPHLDGFGLVRALRADPSTASLPVILISARAGEESAIDGLRVGADDYLIKPFSSRELLARIHTHIKLAKMRRAWIVELERANRELDAFSYSVSHDLRAPLRTIEGFAQALQEDCPQLSNQGQQHLRKIREGVAKMHSLIEALLELARIGRAPVDQEHVDLAELAQAVVQDLHQTDPTRRVSVHIAADLHTHGDRGLLNVVLVNLLGNAWKFTAKSTDAHIEVGRSDDHSSAMAQTFFVRDTGVGFDMQLARQLFQPFQRLHSQNEFSGTGVGLATVQRVIERHGGRIWAQAKPRQGACFFFSLPEHFSRTELDSHLDDTKAVLHVA